MKFYFKKNSNWTSGSHYFFVNCRAQLESINWASPGDTFQRFTKLLKFPFYSYNVVLGLTVSVGGLTESVVSEKIKISNDQELKLSETKSCPRNQMENN